VEISRELHLGDDVGAALRAAYPQLPRPRAGYLLHPVHAWQLAAVLPTRYRDLFDAGVLRHADAPVLAATPTAALRTLLLPGVAAGGRYLKLSLDIQVTSARRSISVASTRNATALSDLVGGLLAEQGALLLPEVAGAAEPAGPGRERDLGAILRHGLTGQLRPGEIAVPGVALAAIWPPTGRMVIDELVAAHPGGASGFLADYAAVLLPAPLRLLAEHGIALEAHLQNTIVTFVDGRPARLVLRDVAGLRLHRQRLADAGHALRLWPGSVVGTDDLDVARAKLGYTLLQAHLGEVVLRLVERHGLVEAEAWATVGAVLVEAEVGRGRFPRRVRAGAGGDRTAAGRAAADLAWLTAPTVPHKALVGMRLDPYGGDRYLPVANPLGGAR
jgi:siderophore synthetase component